MNQNIVLHFPSSYVLATHIAELQAANPDVFLVNGKKNSLCIAEKNYAFDEIEAIEIHFPESLTPLYRQFLAICQKNENYRLEFAPQKINLIMGTSALIGLLTFAVLGSIYAWLAKTKKGNGYSETTPYIFKDENGKTFFKEADASFISFEDCPEEKQNKWLGKPIPVPPTLVIEIVSTKKGTKTAIFKMENIWMRFGSKIGLVICPFTETIYVFEKDKKYEQSIYIPFTHPDLDGYQGDFSNEVRKIMGK